MKRRKAEDGATRPASNVRGAKRNPLLARPSRAEGPPKIQKSPEDQIAEARLQEQAVTLKLRGHTFTAIATQLNVDHKTAMRLVSRALDEYLTDRDEVVHRYFGLNVGRYDQMIRTWAPRALGYVRTDENGQPLRDEAGRPQFVEPDPKAAAIMVRVLRDMNMLIGYGQTLRVEHTGANGGPIMTANLDARAAAQMVREHFGATAPMMIIAEGETVTDDTQPPPPQQQQH